MVVEPAKCPNCGSHELVIDLELGTIFCTVCGFDSEEITNDA